MGEKKKQNQNQYRREIRCPVHNKLIGKYDARYGITNVTYYCPKCHKEHTFTRPRESQNA